MELRHSTNFNLDPVSEISLARAPLEKVLTQIQFSYTPKLVSDEGEQKLAEALPRYPVRRPSQSVNVTVDPATGEAKMKSAVARILTDQQKSWVVTITETAISLETNAYHSRDDFCARALEVFNAVCEVSTPPIVDRVGLRYLDRIHRIEDLKRLDDMVHPKLRVLDGLAETPLVVEYSVSDTIINVTKDEKLRVRSGVFPPGALFDQILVPVSEPSWILDLDLFTTMGGFSFDPAGLESKLRRYSEHIYSFFRWATTDEFQRVFGKGPAATRMEDTS